MSDKERKPKKPGHIKSWPPPDNDEKLTEKPKADKPKKDKSKD